MPRSGGRLALRISGLLLLMAALAMFWLAFTQFDTEAPRSDAGVASYEKGLMQDAQLSVVLGLGGCFALLGAFACHARAGAAPPAGPDPQP